MKYFERRRKEKLYRQWVERAGLPPEAIPRKTDKSEDVPLPIDSPEAVSPEAVSPEAGKSLRVHIKPDSGAVTHPEVTGDMMAEINKRQPHLRMLYILLGVFIVILCGGLAILVVQSC